MRKVLSILLTMLLFIGIMAVSGCNSNSAESDLNEYENNSQLSEDTNNYNDDSSNDSSLTSNNQSVDNSQTDNTQTNNKPVDNSQTNNTQTNNKDNTDSSSNHMHSYGSWVTVKHATCTENGIKQRTCSCGDTQTQTINALGHNYSNDICTRCGKKAPIIESEKFGFGDTAKFYYEYGQYKGDISVTVGNDYTIIAGTLSFADKKNFIRIPVTVNNNGDYTAQLRYEIADIYDSKGESSTYSNPNIITSATCFYDGTLFNENIKAGEKIDGAIYLPYTGAGTYRFVINDKETFNYIFEFVVK